MDRFEKKMLIDIAVTFLAIVLLGYLIGASIHPIDMGVHEPPQTQETAALLP